MKNVIDIVGGGCAGLSLAKQAKNLKNYTINLYTLIEDKKNDHYWGFWKSEEIQRLSNKTVKTWYNWKIINHHNENIFHSTKYPYCVIRKNNWLKESKSIAEKLKVNVFNNKVIEKENSYYVNGKKLNGEYIFDSRPPNFDNNILLQHFHGIEIECDEDKFDFKTAILMDFRCDQSKGIHFIYFLPFSKKRALVESTLFSNKVENKSFYVKEIKKYLKNILKVNNYIIIHQETGVIPMSYICLQNKNSINIGTRGGATKPSSGYTFNFIQYQINKIVNQIKSKKEITNEIHNKFDLYMDKIFIDVLNKKQISIPNLFIDLTKNLSGDEMARFMSGKSDFKIWLKVIKKLPKVVFLISLIKVSLYG